METNKIKEVLRNPEDNIIRVSIIVMMMLTTVMAVERRWSLCEVWLFGGIPVFLIVGLAMLVLKKSEFEYTLTDAVISIWFAYYVGRTWVGNEWPCQMEFLKTVELFLLYVSLRFTFHGTKISGWVLIGAILVFGCYEAWLGASQLYGNEVSRHSLFALTGSFLNPGPYSAYLMIGIVIGLASLKDMEGIRRHWIVAAVVIMAVILPATWSRAAFLGVAVVVLTIYRDKYWKYRYLVWAALLVSAIALYLIKQGSAEGRLIIWRAALTIWTGSPWLGVGVGGFLHTFAEGMTQLSSSEMDFSSANVPDGAYNILLKIIVEQGIAGGLMAICLVVVALTKLSRNSKPLFYGIVALLMFSMFSYPFDLLPYKVISVMVVAWSESVGGIRLFEIGRFSLCFLSASLGFASWLSGNVANDCYKIENEGYMSFGYMSYSSYEEGYRCLAAERDNHELLFAFGKKLREEGRYNNSNAVLWQGTRCSADPMFYILMGNNYKDMKHYDLAEQAYKKAFSVMPNRLYPLYQLMLLYQECGSKQEAKAMAKRVVSFKEKIVSPATRDMRKKAKSILNDTPVNMPKVVETLISTGRVYPSDIRIDNPLINKILLQIDNDYNGLLYIADGSCSLCIGNLIDFIVGLWKIESNIRLKIMTNSKYYDILAYYLKESVNSQRYDIISIKDNQDIIQMEGMNGLCIDVRNGDVYDMFYYIGNY